MGRKLKLNIRTLSVYRWPVSRAYMPSSHENLAQVPVRLCREAVDRLQPRRLSDFAAKRLTDFSLG